jgi:hypothetical protein
MTQKRKFICQKCGKHELRAVFTGSVQTSRVFVEDVDENKYLEYDDIEDFVLSSFSHFECAGCLFMLCHGDGRTVGNDAELISWLNEHKEQDTNEKD